ncbi:MAG: patatin-like protein [Candidatus Aminicenantes bacterium]|nr:patatin-like protein [Candidatus Aminicenantes bacterium]
MEANGDKKMDEEKNNYPEYNPTKEVRLGVVMYGGISLAIYMNGVTQELYKLVRATAPSTVEGTHLPLLSNNQLKGTERIYRKLAQNLTPRQWADWLGLDIECPEKGEESSSDPPTIQTRFIIDILSGTSAGGINAVFLAKALVEQKEIDELKKLWIEEGDIEKLLNDKKFTGLPASLLDGKRIYRKLLHALESMEDIENKSAASPFVDELDLFVTATDIRGLPVPIRLSSGKLVYEKRHRHHFHFLYADKKKTQFGRNDFEKKNDPFLAFAARCTSSFPFAFEPMTLADIEKLCPNQPKSEQMNKWIRLFFKHYISSPIINKGNNIDYDSIKKIAFGDGGYLDNKPFSYAIDALKKRRSDLPVDRKLIYLEPVPDHPEKEVIPEVKPDFIENVLAATLSLPRYETIGEDLERLLEHNRLIERVNGLIQPILDRVHRDQDDKNECFLPADKWKKKGLDYMVEKKGMTYEVYHRLKIQLVLDEFSLLVARHLGLEEDSDYVMVARRIVKAWLEGEYSGGGKDGKTQNEFLLNFDFSYRLRRIAFVQRKINELFILGPAAEKSLKEHNKDLNFDEVDDDRKRLYQNELKALKIQFNDKIFIRLRNAGRELRKRANITSNSKVPLCPIKVATESLQGKINLDKLKEYVQPGSEKIYENWEKDIYKKNENEFKKYTTAIASCLSNLFIECSREFYAIIKKYKKNADKKQNDLLRTTLDCIKKYYQCFENYDMIIFPVLYDRDMGEADKVEVIRLSPEDATHLIDENKEGEKRRKLAGTALGHFGAFLDEFWRRNDILWGRLDAAEMIITTLFKKKEKNNGINNKKKKEQSPGDKILKDVLAHAHKTIIAEELSEKEKTGFTKMMCKFLKSTLKLKFKDKDCSPNADDLLEVVECYLKGSDLTPKSQDVLLKCLDKEQLFNHLKDKDKNGYEISRKLDPKFLLRIAARCTKVVGKMFKGLSLNDSGTGGEQTFSKISSKISSWLIKFGRLFAFIVEFAIPGSVKQLLFRHWVKLLYPLTLFAISLGIVMGWTTVRNAGWIGLGVTPVVQIIVSLLKNFMQGKKTCWNIINFVFKIVITFLAAVGLLVLLYLADFFLLN